MNNQVFVSSEIGKLQEVLLHRPNKELESLMPQYLDSMLFEDIPFVNQMQEEHDQFAQLLTEQGCIVRYVESLLTEIFNSDQVKEEAISYLLESSFILSQPLKQCILEYLTHTTIEELVEICISGMLKSTIDDKISRKSLSYYLKDSYPYYIAPLPNLYFTRDPATIVLQTMCIHVMKTEARKREEFLISLIAKNHNIFSSSRVLNHYSDGKSIEGGDVLVLSSSCVAIGCSARTDAWAIEAFCEKMLTPGDQGEGIKKVIVIQIPFTRAYMHLDTVFTMVDYDKFCIFPQIEPLLHVFTITKKQKGSLRIEKEKNLSIALERALAIPAVTLIRSGGGDPIISVREQWNDSTNTLCIAPGKVVTYQRNVITNETLSKHNIEVLTIKGSELVRGRGGPRCMSMPLSREEL